MFVHEHRDEVSTKIRKRKIFSSFLVFTFNRKWTIDCYHSELRPAYNGSTRAVHSTPHLTLTSRPPGPAWWWSLPAVRSHTQRSSHSPLLHTSTLPPCHNHGKLQNGDLFVFPVIKEKSQMFA